MAQFEQHEYLPSHVRLCQDLWFGLSTIIRPSHQPDLALGELQARRIPVREGAAPRIEVPGLAWDSALPFREPVPLEDFHPLELGTQFSQTLWLRGGAPAFILKEGFNVGLAPALQEDRPVGVTCHQDQILLGLCPAVHRDIVLLGELMVLGRGSGSDPSEPLDVDVLMGETLLSIPEEYLR